MSEHESFGSVQYGNKSQTAVAVIPPRSRPLPCLGIHAIQSTTSIKRRSSAQYFSIPVYSTTPLTTAHHLSPLTSHNVPQILLFAALVSVPLFAIAAPAAAERGVLVERAIAERATTIVYQCPPSILSADVAGLVNDILGDLQGLGPVLNTVNGLVGGLLNTVSNLLSGVGGLLGGLTGGTTSTVSSAQINLNNLVDKLTSIVTTCGGLNKLVSHLEGGIASVTNGDDFYKALKAVLTQLNTILGQINTLISNNKGTLNLTALKTVLVNLLTQLTAIVPPLSTQCGTSVQTKAIIDLWDTLKATLNVCIIAI
ncbi:hypothetical protein DFH06DRAFT_1229460 [Mycena polygramma]|nr:hypothetical protein DFH06DRAFT_1229460 [Mycena polygramma]